MSRWISPGIVRVAATVACALVALFAAPVWGQSVGTFGTSALTYTAVGSNAFIPVNNTITYLNNIYLTGTEGGDFTAGPLLPSGALLASIQWSFCSENASMAPSHGMQLVGRDGTVIKGLSSGADPIGPGCTTVTDDLSDLNMIVDNLQNRVELTLTPAIAADQFTVAIIGYKLQVSPAPASATFGDVPASHPFFQYVEALAASGITGGCGAGKFCPDTPVTRGQMAVFLAKALGLQWP